MQDYDKYKSYIGNRGLKALFRELSGYPGGCCANTPHVSFDGEIVRPISLNCFCICGEVLNNIEPDAFNLKCQL